MDARRSRKINKVLVQFPAVGKWSLFIPVADCFSLASEQGQALELFVGTCDPNVVGA